jgi:hypothetical protein
MLRMLANFGRLMRRAGFYAGELRSDVSTLRRRKRPMASISLHIGVPKTATSHIQAWLHTNRFKIREYGVFVPNRPIHAHRLAVELLSGGIWDSRADLLEIRRTPLDMARQSINEAVRSQSFAEAIISSEYFYYADPAQVRATFRDWFGSDLTVVVYVRSQGELVLSGHNQDVKRLGKTASRPPPSYAPLYDWGLLLDGWAKQIGKENLKVISFDASSRRDTILQDFVAAACPGLSAHLTDGSLRDAGFFNESLPADLLEFKRLANTWGEFGLADLLEEALQNGYAGPRFGVGQDEASEWRALYQASNAYVAKEYFSGATVDEMFPRDPEGKPGVDLEGQLPIETVAKLLALAMKRDIQHRAKLEERLKALEAQLLALQQQRQQQTPSR